MSIYNKKINLPFGLINAKGQGVNRKRHILQFCFASVNKTRKTDERCSSSLLKVVISAASEEHNRKHTVTTPAVSQEVLLVSIT